MTQPAESIDLDQTPEPNQTIDLGLSPAAPKVDPKVTSSTASKAEYGLKNHTGQSYVEIQQALLAGNEKVYRQSAAAKVDDNNRKDVVTGQAPVSTLLNRTNPDTVIENKYADKYVKSAFNLKDPWNSDTSAHDAQSEIPGHVLQTQDMGIRIATAKQMLISGIDEMEAAYNNQSWLSWGGQQVAGMIPYLEYLTLHGQVPGAQGKLLPGDDIEEQANSFYGLSTEEQKEVIDRVKNQIGSKNPALAASFFRQLHTMSDDERVQRNFLGVIDLGTIAGLSGSLLRKATLFNDTRQATRDVVHSSGQNTGIRDPELPADMAAWENEGGAIGREPVETTAARGRGDLGEAAIQKTSQRLIEEAQGKSHGQLQAIEDLTSEHRFDIDNLVNDERLGTSERELATRLAASIHRHDLNVIKALSADRPDRVPLAEHVTEVVQVAEQAIRDNWKGVNNSILDIKTRPTEITNVREHEIQIGTPGGKLFPSRKAAEENAELNGLVAAKSGVSWDRGGQLGKLIRAAKDRLEFGPSAEEKALEAEGGPAVLEDKLRANIKEWEEELGQGPTLGYRIEPQGRGFYISYRRPMKEWVDAVDSKGRKLGWEIPVNEAFQTKLERKVPSLWEWWKTPAFERKYAKGETPYLRDQGIMNFLKSIMTRIRNPDEALAREVSEQRKLASFLPNVFKELYVEPSSLVPKRLWPDVNRILEAQQTYPDPVTGIPGYTFRTLPEINHQYMLHNGRLPEESELQAIQAFNNNNDLDLAGRRIAKYIPKATMGAEQFQFSYKGEQGRIKSGFFEGVEHKGIPGGEGNILVVNHEGGAHQIYKANDVKFLRARKKLAEKEANGQVKVLELVAGKEFPLRSLGPIGDELIKYVITEGVLDRKPLSLIGQVPRRGGGHLVPDYNHFGKQAHIHRDRVGSRFRDVYIDDKTWMVFADRLTGKQVIDKANKVRELLQRDESGRFRSLAEARKVFGEQGLPMSWEEFVSDYRPKRNPTTGLMEPPRLDVREPLVLTSKDEKGTMPTVLEATGNYYQQKYPHSFVDSYGKGSIADSIHVEFTQQRNLDDLKTISDVGTARNPIYNYQPAKMVDPTQTQNRALSRILNSTINNDVKYHSINKWLTDALPYLDTKKGATPERVWHSPYTYFSDGPNLFREGVPLGIKQALLANHGNIQRFLGRPSTLDSFLHSAAQEVADTIHGTLGPKLVPRWLLSRVKDPVPFMRSMTYSVDMGLGSVKQMLTQYSAIANVTGLSPKSAPAATMAQLLHTYAYFNNQPEILDHLDDLATKMQIPGMRRFKPGQWKEARQMMIDQGFTTVDEEHALARDYPLSASIVKSGGAKVLDLGRLPFTMGASAVRAQAFYTSYLEFRDLHPTGRLTRGDRSEILAKASLYDHDMNRSSNTVLHSGSLPASLMGQFMAYDLRLMDIMWGKRVSPEAKARLFATSSIFYGLPSGGLGITGFAAQDWLRKKVAEEYSYIPGAGQHLMDAVSYGLPSLMLAAITGRTYDLSKFGSRGAPYIADMLSSDTSMWKILFGAVGSGLESAITNANNLYKSTMPEFLGGTKDMKFKLPYLLENLKTFAAGDAIYKTAAAIHTGKWYSNNGTSLADDISVPNAIFMALSGIPEVRFNQKFMYDSIMRDQEKLMQDAVRGARADIGLYLQALKDNHDDAGDYYNNAIVKLHIAGVPESEMPRALAAIFRGHESTIRETNERYLKSAPPGKEEQRMNVFDQLQSRDLGLK